MTNIAFEAWPCYRIGAGGNEGRFLKADVAVICGTGSHYSILLIASAGVVIYAGGLIVLNAVLLWTARQAIFSEAPTRLSHALAFIHSEYHPICCWWSLCETVRQFLLVGLFRIIMPGEITQLILATLLVILYLVLQVQALPYRNESDAYLAMAVTVSLFVELFCCNLYKWNTLVDLVTAQDAQLNTQTPMLFLFRLDASFVTVTIMLSILTSLVFALALTALKAREDARRRREERDLASDRRLRRVADDSDVVPPRLPQAAEQHYHLFLSHVWGTGQDQMRVVKSRLNEMIPGIQVFLGMSLGILRTTVMHKL